MDTTETQNRNEARGSIPPEFVIHTRAGGTEAESTFEKPVILPEQSEQSPSLHAWADA